MNLAQPSQGTVGMRTKLLYAAGTIAFGIKDGGLAAFLLLFYNQVMGMPASLVGEAIAIVLVIDAILNPVIGQISDHWRSRFGRRHPFMYAAAVPAAVAFVLLWNPPEGWSHGMLFIYIVVVASLTRAFVTLFEVPNTALSAELTDDYDERTQIFSLRIFFSTFGGSVMLIVTYMFFLQPSPEYPVGQLNPVGYSNYGLAAAAIMLCTMLMSALGTHHRIPYFRSPPPRRSRPLPVVAREIYATVSNSSFVPILGASLSHAMALGVGASLYIYMFIYFWGMSASQLSIMMIPNVAGALLGIAIAPYVSRTVGKKRGAIALKLVTVLCFVLPILLRLMGYFPENGSPWLLPLLVVFALVANTLGLSATMLNGAMTADIVEDSELKTGRRSEGLFFAAQDFVAKAVSGAGVFISGLVLTHVQFPVGAVPGEIPQDTVDKLGWTYMPVIGGLYALAVVFLLFYRITRQSHQENLRRLQAARASAPLSAAADVPLPIAKPSVREG
jgi:glycoside/pentoside/hexuronide:cation symporter, GPH family